MFYLIQLLYLLIRAVSFSSESCSGNGSKVLLPSNHHIQQGGVQIGECLFLNPIGDSVCRLGDAASDGGQGVAVAAQGDGVADGVLEVPALQKGDDSLRDGLLAGLVEPVAWPDLVQRPGQVIAIFPLDVLPDPLLAPLRPVTDGAFIFPVPAAEMVAAHENCVCDGRSSLDPLEMVGVTWADRVARFLPTVGHMPVLAQKPQSMTHAQGETRMAEPFPKLL